MRQKSSAAKVREFSFYYVEEKTVSSLNPRIGIVLKRIVQYKESEIQKFPC